jgi:hypothetical protein
MREVVSCFLCQKCEDWWAAATTGFECHKNASSDPAHLLAVRMLGDVEGRVHYRDMYDGSIYWT